jgi:hypothetical protein
VAWELVRGGGDVQEARLLLAERHIFWANKLQINPVYRDFKRVAILMSTQKSLLTVMSLFIAALVSGQVFAASVQGTLDMGGLFTPSPDPNNDLASATHVQFDSEVFLGATGDFIGTTTGGLALADFGFSPLDPDPLSWTLGAFTLSLTSMTVTAQSATQLLLRGVGTLDDGVGGFDPTPATLSWTGNGPGDLKSWSATVSAVPVPAAVWLFGSGLIGLVGMARRKKAV